MFSIAPITFGATSSVGSSRIPHLEQTQIEALIISSVDEVVNEWTQYGAPLGPKSRSARNLFASLDHFLSNGCLEGNRTYWRFIREFIPKSHRRYFQRECHVRSDRDLSIVWLKDSINRQVIPYYFQSFLLNWPLVRKYYTTNAMIRKRSVLQRVVEKTYEISDVAFCFVIRSEEKNSVPIAEVRSPQPTTTLQQSPTPTIRASRRRKVLRNSDEADDAANSAISDVQIAPDLVENPPDSETAPFLSTAKDFDYVFAEMIQKGERQLPTTSGALPENQNSLPKVSSALERTRLQAIASEAAKTNSHAKASELDGAINEFVNPFDVALKSSLSHAKLVSSRGQDIPAKKLSSPPPLCTDSAPFGEICLDVGEVIGLSINVFKTETEKFLRFFQVYEGFGTGQPQQRFLVLSNRSIYLLSMEYSSSMRKSYVTRSYLPLKHVEFIAVSPDYQVLFIHAEKGYSSDGLDGGSQAVEVCTACTQLGETIVHAISFAYSDIAMVDYRDLDVFTEMTSHHFILNKFMAKELPEEKVLLKCFTLAQWRQTSLECPGGNGVQHCGFLYHKSLRSGSWLLNTGEFQQSFFHLQNRKFYQFTDSSCKVGERVISLQESVLNVSKVNADDSQHIFEMEFQNGERMQFQCQSRSEMEKWLLLLTSAISSTGVEDEAVACVVAISLNYVLVAQEGENCVVDGFMRTLTTISVPEIKQATGVLAAERFACVLNDGKKLDWLFLRSPDEVDRVLAVFQELEVPHISREEDGCSRLVALVNSLPRSGDLFYFENAHSDDAFETCVNY